jgi:RNA polymerase sigma factor (sigma-70 family)
MRRAIRPEMGGVSAPLVVQILQKAEYEIARAVAHYRRVLRKVAWVDVDDLEQHAKIAAIEAHCTFDPTKHTQLATWTNRVVRARLHDFATSILDPTEIVYAAHRKNLPEDELDALRQGVRSVTTPVVSIEAQQHGDVGATTTSALFESELSAEVHRGESPEEQAVASQHARKVFAIADRVLTPHERLVFHAELAGTRGEVIAKKLGVSKQAVGATRKRALERLRTALTG